MNENTPKIEVLKIPAIDKQDPKPKHPGGRPLKTIEDLPKDWRQTIHNEMKQGASRQEIKAKLCISNDLFARLMREDIEFSDTIKENEALSYAWWLNIARENLKDRSFSAVLWYMNMKNRFGWKDKQEKEHKNNTAAVSFDVKKLSNDDLAYISNMLKRIQQLEKLDK